MVGFELPEVKEVVVDLILAKNGMALPALISVTKGYDLRSMRSTITVEYCENRVTLGLSARAASWVHHFSDDADMRQQFIDNYLVPIVDLITM